MRLLIITQKVDKDDPILGFFHRWIEEFSKRFEKIIVICLEEGQHNLPKNVSVHSLGKERRVSNFKKLTTFYHLIFSLRKHYDSVFVHMNPEYVVLGGIFWKFLRKKVSLWYVHRQVNLKLRIAEKLSDIIFSSTPESFRIKSKKVSFVGHGIDVSKFNCEKKDLADKIVFLHVGRITKIKNCDIAIQALSKVVENFPDRKISLRFVGPTVSVEDVVFLNKLKGMVEDLKLDDKVEFVGSVKGDEISKQYCLCDATLNLTPTGGMDKVVLESLISKRPVFTSNFAFKSLFNELEGFIFEYKNPDDLSGKMSDFIRQNGDVRGSEEVYEKVVEKFSLVRLANMINEKLK